MKWSDVTDLRWKDLKKINRADLLDRVGLRESTPASDFFTGLGLFAVGMAVGAGLGVLFAPKPGAETREKLTGSLRSRAGQVREDFERKTNDITSPGTRVS
jgi:hypothetical protein